MVTVEVMEPIEAIAPVDDDDDVRHRLDSEEWYAWFRRTEVDQRAAKWINWSIHELVTIDLVAVGRDDLAEQLRRFEFEGKAGQAYRLERMLVTMGDQIYDPFIGLGYAAEMVVVAARGLDWDRYEGPMAFARDLVALGLHRWSCHEMAIRLLAGGWPCPGTEGADSLQELLDTCQAAAPYDTTREIRNDGSYNPWL
jgi:hypothetical protein